MKLQRFFKIIELDNENNHVSYHEFEASDYRAITSMNAFFWGTKHYNRSKSRLYSARREDEWVIFEKSWSNPTTPIIKHESIWDFYIHIGYDYKKKKYMER